MVINALLRGGERINFWQAKSGYLGDLRLFADRALWDFDFWCRKRGTVERQLSI
jgi:hypothetical protein